MTHLELKENSWKQKFTYVFIEIRCRPRICTQPKSTSWCHRWLHRRIENEICKHNISTYNICQFNVSDITCLNKIFVNIICVDINLIVSLRWWWKVLFSDATAQIFDSLKSWCIVCWSSSKICRLHRFAGACSVQGLLACHELGRVEKDHQASNQNNRIATKGQIQIKGGIGK